MRENKFKKALRAVIIARVSTEPQGDDDHHSLPGQLRNLEDYVKRGGKFGALSDKGIERHELRESAFQGNRPEFSKIIENLDENETVALIFDDIDRFSRQVRSKLLVNLDKLRKEGKIELHFVTSNLAVTQNSSANEIMVWNILMAVAEGQSKMISEKVKKGNREKLEKGEFIGYSPTGYLNVKTQIDGENRFKREIKIDESKAEFIKKCFRLYSTGRYVVSELVEIMQKAGFTTKGKKIRNGNNELEEKTAERKAGRNDINAILRNPFYYGKFYRIDPETGNRALFPRSGLATNYEPLIDKNLFGLVQNVLNSKNTRINGYTKNNFKFRGLLKCSFCDCAITPEEMSRTYGKKSKGKNINQVYYHCSNGHTMTDPDFYEKKFGKDHSGIHIYKGKNKKKKGQKIISCPQRWWKEEEIEALILAEFDMLHYDDNVYEMLKRGLAMDYDERMKMVDKETKGLKIKYGKNESKIRAFTQKLVTITDKRLEEDMMSEYNRLKEEQESLRDEMKIYEEAKELDTDKIIDTMKLACNLRGHYESLDSEKQRELLSICFDKITATKGEWKLNGRKVKVEAQIYPVFSEAFALLRSLKIDEILPVHDEKHRNIKLTNVSDLKASLNP